MLALTHYAPKAKTKTWASLSYRREDSSVQVPSAKFSPLRVDAKNPCGALSWPSCAPRTTEVLGPHVGPRVETLEGESAFFALSYLV